jgi:transposase
LGHTVKLMPPAYVKPYVKRGKTDAADAEAICEAVTRPTMRFVAIKTADQQAALMLHKTRDLLVRQRTMLINGLRGHPTEFGVIAAKGSAGVKAVIKALHAAKDQLPEPARPALHGIVDQLRLLGAEIERLEARIIEWHRSNDVSRRLAAIPGIGPITAAVPNGSLFSSGRQFAAMARPDTESTQQRRQGTTRRHQQAGRRLSPPLACRRRHDRDAICPKGQRRPKLGDETAGTQAGQTDRGRAGKQDGADRLDDHDAGDDLCAASSIDPASPSFSAPHPTPILLDAGGIVKPGPAGHRLRRLRA